MTTSERSKSAEARIDQTTNLFFTGAQLLHEVRQQSTAKGVVRFRDWSAAICENTKLNSEITSKRHLIWLWECLRLAPDLLDLFGDLPPATVPWSSKDQRFEVFGDKASFVIGMNAGEISQLLQATAKAPAEERVSVLTEEPLRMRPGKKDRLECCDCEATVTIRVEKAFSLEREADIMRIEADRITIDGKTITVRVDSLNQAYTISSRRLEPRRRSHGGRTYDHMVHAGKGTRITLEDIRQLVESGEWRPSAAPPPLIESLFSEPEQWGLRGDPYLWRELRQRFIAEGLPQSLPQFKGRLECLFRELIGFMLATSQETVYIERYAHGGMSSGHVEPAWWRTKGIPLLEKRFRLLQSQSPPVSKGLFDESN